MRESVVQSATELSQGEVMQQGNVVWFNAQKGYGFIRSNESGKEYFVHYSSINGEGYKTLEQGQSVSFDVEQGPKGMQASNVTAS